jgi:hypothetical protein
MVRTEEVGRAFLTGILLFLMRTLETFSARDAGLVFTTKVSLWFLNLASGAGLHVL